VAKLTYRQFDRKLFALDPLASQADLQNMQAVPLVIVDMDRND
jgi:hypothetical protein